MYVAFIISPDNFDHDVYMVTVFDMVWQYLLFKTPKVVIVIITLLENINGISNHINDDESNDDDDGGGR